MASQSAEPAAPQSEVVHAAGANKPARKGAYVDVALTTRNAESSAAASDLPPGSGSTTLGGVRPVYAADKVADIDSTAAAAANVNVDPPPHSPNSPQMQTRNGGRYARDPYANGGQAQYLNNQGG